MNNVSSLKNKISTFPDSPGVYMFVGAKGEILYIGKATSLHDRLKSYFGDDLIATRGRRVVDMVALSRDIKVTVTLSVLEALILEANLIKKYQPKYNAKEKDNKSFNYVVITKEKFPRVTIVRGRTLEMVGDKKRIKYSFGPFTSGSSLRAGLSIIRKIFPFADFKCKGPKPCFNSQMGLCPGVCTGSITVRDYAKNIRNIKLFFEGKKGQLIKTLEKEMNAAAKALRFEEAGKIKKTIFALDHINDIALIKAEEETPPSLPFSKGEVPEGQWGFQTPPNPSSDISGMVFTGQTSPNHHSNISGGVLKSSVRIEAYDIAHLSGTSTVGVMVVVENGEPARSQYRKFKIRGSKDKVNDPKHLSEIFTRRLGHPEWSMPNIIVVDGNNVQGNVARGILKEKGFDIEVVSVVKDVTHKAREILGSQEIIKKYKAAILLANAEAHRFAIAYHRLIRRRRFAN